MRTWKSVGVLIFGIAAVGLAVLAQPTQGNGLPERVQLEVGRIGPNPFRETWAIEKSGEWTHSQQGEQINRGQLSQKQQQALTHYLAINEFTTLVGSTGFPVEDLVGDLPRWFIIIRVGDQRAILVADEPPIVARPRPTVVESSKDVTKDAAPKDGLSRLHPTPQPITPGKWDRIVTLSQLIPAVIRLDHGRQNPSRVPAKDAPAKDAPAKDAPAKDAPAKDK